MSAEAMTWAKAQDLPLVEKFLLVLVADEANHRGQAVLTGEQLAAQAGCARSTAMANLRKLELRGLLKRQPQWRADGGAARSIVQLFYNAKGPDREPDTPPGPGDALTPGREPDSHAGGRDHQLSTTTSKGHSARETIQETVHAGAVPVTEAVGRDAAVFLREKRKVGTRIVTAEEMAKAAAAMSEFNRQAGTEQGLGPNLVAIVGRVREHPSWDPEKYVRLVQSAFRLRWWEKNGRRRKGAVTPKVIFGSTECFVNVANDAADEAAGRDEQIVARRGKYDRDVVRDD